jgi:membrane associated rhomboid family serine protease
MLEDRDYMRQPEFGQRRWLPHFHLHWSWTVGLLLSYFVVHVVTLAVQSFFPGNPFFNIHFAGSQLVPAYLPLSAQGLAKGYAWQLVTYQFMHAGWMHLIFNCWAIYVFGIQLEDLLGSRRFLALVFASGIVGGIFQVLTAMLWPGLFGGPVVGASACAFGLVAAFAMIFPEQELTMLIFFVIPLRLRAKTLLILSLVIALMGIIFPMDHVANAAHLGGMAMGWFYVKAILKNPALLGGPEEERSYRSAPTEAETSSSHDSVDADVDAVLDKISAHGINSLTARERAILEAARKKMAQP